MALSRNRKNSSHDSGRRDRITSPVFSSLRIKTSLPSKRNSAGRRTAWLLPLLNSFAVRGMVLASPPAFSSPHRPYASIYHDILQGQLLGKDLNGYKNIHIMVCGWMAH